jgi:hypothetical protein
VTTPNDAARIRFYEHAEWIRWSLMETLVIDNDEMDHRREALVRAIGLLDDRERRIFEAHRRQERDFCRRRQGR